LNKSGIILENTTILIFLYIHIAEIENELIPCASYI